MSDPASVTRSGESCSECNRRASASVRIAGRFTPFCSEHMPYLGGERPRKRLLDLFCGAGGAAMGYHRAGFEVVGVDINPQPHYPFEFHQADALDWLSDVVLVRRTGLHEVTGINFRFDAIHVSPPCQAYSKALRHLSGDYPKLIATTRDLLNIAGLPYVIENVPGADLRPDYILCGCYFALPRLRRPRWFETSWRGSAQFPAHRHGGQAVNVDGHGTPGRVYRAGQPAPTQADRRAAMGIDWMNRNELAEAIPPAFTEFIGKRLLEMLAAVAA